MTKTASTGELGINLEAFDLSDDFEALGQGFNSRVVRFGERVIKATKKTYSPNEALALAGTMLQEDRMMADCIAENMPATLYVVTHADNGDARVVTVQEFKEGMRLREYLALPLEQQDRASLIDFYQRCLELPYTHNIIPDLANVETGFNIEHSKNIVVNPVGPDAHKPFLVDTNFGKIQRSRALGPLWTRLIVGGVKRGIRKLESGTSV